MQWDRFDICEAYYMFATLYHSGQYSKTYEIFGRLERMQFKPSVALSVDSLTDNGRLIYNNLVNRRSK